MSRKIKKSVVTKQKSWKYPLSLLGGGVLIVVVCLVVRNYWRPGAASAQAQRGGTTAAAGRNILPTTARTPSRKARDTSKLKTMAVVNGQEISRQQLAQEAVLRYGKEVLESLVNKHLILAACHDREIVITQKDVDAEVTRLAAKFGLSADRWLEMLQSERDLTPLQYRNDIVWPTLALRRIAAKQIEVSSKEINDMMESEFGPRVKVRIISVNRRKKADKILKLAQANPNNFGNLAKDHSEDPNSASAYGLIPPIRRYVGNPDVEKAAYSLKPGEISQVIPVANQFLIIKCEETLPRLNVEEVHLKTARTRIIEHLRDKKLRTVAASLFKKMQDEARVVNVYNDPKLRRQHPGVAALINNRELSMRELSEECITRHGLEVLSGEINRQILLQQLKRRNIEIQNDDLKREVAIAAVENSFQKKDGSPDTNAWIDAVTKKDGATVDLYISDAVWPTVAVKKLVASSVKVTKEDMQKGFEANYGPRVEVLAIVLSNNRQAQQVWEMARNNPTEKFFGQLSKQYSLEGVSANNQGKVPPIQKHGGRPTLEREAFRLKPGEISGIIAVGGKYIILRCLGQTKPVIHKIDTVRDLLYKDLYEKKLRIAMANEFNRLHAEAQIDNFLAGTIQTGKKTTLPAGTTTLPPRAKTANRRASFKGIR